MAVSGPPPTGPPALYFLTAHGCGEEADRLAEAPAGEEVLDTASKGADGKDRYRGCDDDRFVVVGAR
ncbi:hypothetical protein [Streptomyces sp. YIM B13518]|uniref:hypothetical protein n=1 Tax=Streptomyces sp. YIM B13518 TaxID=3366316 RepID=UPI00369B829D